MFVLQKGTYSIAKMEYSYARRAQSVSHTLHWKDIAIIDTELIQDAIVEAESVIKDWAQKGFTAERWRVEGRGKQIQQSQEIFVS